MTTEYTSAKVSKQLNEIYKGFSSLDVSIIENCGTIRVIVKGVGEVQTHCDNDGFWQHEKETFTEKLTYKVHKMDNISSTVDYLINRIDELIENVRNKIENYEKQ